MIKAVIVDDEERSIENLKKLLTSYCEDVEIVGTARTIQDAYTIIEKHKPVLVFLDVDMPPNTGFDLLKKYEEIPFDVIFVTAYDYYAIDAIKFSALYYIMKPVKIDELKEAVEKAKNKLLRSNHASSTYLKSLSPYDDSPKRIVISTLKDTELVMLEDIHYVEADNVYSTLFLEGNRRLVCSQRSIKDYEEMLTGKGFFRCHKSYIVNLKQISRIEKQEGGEIILKNNRTSLPLARRRKEDLLKLLR